MSVLGTAHPDGYRQIDPAEAIQHRHDLLVVDVREAHEQVHDRLPRSQAVPLSRIGEAARAWSPGQPILVVSENGRSSAKAALELQGLGFTVYSLSGGLARWRSRGLPLESVEDEDFITGDEPEDEDDDE